MKNRLANPTCLAILLTATQPAHAIEQSQVDELLQVFRGNSAMGNPNIHMIETGSIAASSKHVKPISFPHGKSFLRGENDELSLEFFLSPVDVLSGIELELGFKNSVTVLPEQSELSLFINDQFVKSVSIRHSEKDGKLTARLDAAILKSGVNKVSLSAKQYHRVDCSLDATYELWTQILTDKSFVKYNLPKRHIQNLSELQGFVHEGAQTQNLVLVPNEPHMHLLSDDQLETYAGLAQKVSRIGKFSNPEVGFLSEVNRYGSGIDIFVGTSEELSNNAYINETYDNPDLGLILRNVEDRVALISSNSGKRILLAQLEDLMPDNKRGLSDAAADKSITGLEKTTVSFKELGYKEFEFGGKRFSRQMDLQLPADFYPSDYDTIKLHLFGSYASGLKTGQHLIVNVNGAPITSVPFSKGAGDIFYDRVLEIPLSTFKPGSNNVEIVALLELQDEKECELIGSRTRDAALFISDKSNFEIPVLAKAGRFPDVQNTLQTGYPYRVKDDRGDLLVTLKGDKNKSFEVAASFLAQISGTANVDIPVAISSNPQREDQNNYLNKMVVAPFNDVPQSFAQLRAEVNWKKLDNNWSNFALASSQIDEIITASIEEGTVVNGKIPSYQNNIQLQSEASSYPSEQPVKKINERDTKLQSMFQEHAKKERDSLLSFSVSGKLANLLSPLKGSISNLTSSKKETETVSEESQFVVSQLVKNDVMVTLIGYPQDNQSATMNFIANTYASNHTVPYHSVGMSLSGKHSGIHETSPVLVMDNNFSLSNMRKITAGWLSNQPYYFALLFLLSLIGASAFTTVALNSSKRSSGEEFETDA